MKKSNQPESIPPILLQYLQAGVVVHASDTHILSASDQASIILGLSMNQLMGKKAIDPAWSFVREDETPMPLEEYPVNRVIATRQPLRGLVLGINRPATRDRAWVLVNAFPEFSDENNLLQVVVTFIDITKQKQAEISLNESKIRLNMALDAAQMGMWDWDIVSGKIIWSEIHEILLGYEPGTFPGTIDAFNKCVHPDDRAEMWRIGELSKRTRKPFKYEYRVIWPNGSVHWIASHGRYIFDSNGKAIRLVGVLFDITERKQAEAQQEILREQLMQAQKMDSIGQLAGGIAHDLNNILTVQKGYCELMLPEVKENDLFSEGVTQIDHCTDRATDLIRQLLAFSRKQILRPKIIELNSLLNNLVKMLKRLIREDILLLTFPAYKPAIIKADQSQIEQVIINLILNARDAMPQGGKLDIEISHVELDKSYTENHMHVVPGSYVMLAISDTGCGMDDETKKRIFEPFFTTKEKGKGTGLGLATVYGIIKQSGGNIWVYSELGKGTTFKIYLPSIEEFPTENVIRKKDIKRGTGEYILIIEDEPALRELTVLTIEKLGYWALGAINAKEAIQMVENDGLRPNLVITDVIMPEMSGINLVERLSKTISDLKVIYMSGYTDNTIIHHGILESGVNFLQKPFSRADIAAKIREALESKK